MKQELPTRKYCHGGTELAAFRLHKPLMKVLNKIAKDKGWTLTDVARLAMDEYAVAMKDKSKKTTRRVK